MAVLRDLGASIAASGFKKVVLYNTHGGNNSLVDVMARDLRAEFGLRTFSLFGSPGAQFDGVSQQERTYGFHAGEIETAFLLHATPELVRNEEYTSRNCSSPKDRRQTLRGSRATSLPAA
jgi:creatinine amidohydrolase